MNTGYPTPTTTSIIPCNGGMGVWALRGRGVPLMVVFADRIFGLDVVKMTRSLKRLGYETGTPPPGWSRRLDEAVSRL